MIFLMLILLSGKNILSRYKEEGIEGLRVALKLLDPEHYAKVDLKNYKRIIRALEICETTGQAIFFLPEKAKKRKRFRNN